MMKMMMMMDGSEENACCLWHATTIILLHKVIVAVSCASKWNNNTGWWYFSTFFVSSLVIYRPGHAESPLCVRIQDEPHSTIIHNVWESHVETISLIILCTHTHTERLLLWTPIRMNCMNETRVSNVHSPQKERSQPNTIFFFGNDPVPTKKARQKTTIAFASIYFGRRRPKRTTKEMLFCHATFEEGMQAPMSNQNKNDIHMHALSWVRPSCEVSR